jgi:quercetin dioxygenase-like cupin family protein
MVRRTILVFVSLTAVVAILMANAVATPSSGVSAVTARGDVVKDLNLKTKFADDVEVEIETEGPVEFATQRIEALPGATFGWHTHPGENINVMLQGTLTLYHDEKCTRGIAYGPGKVFTTSPKDVHLARNEGTETLVLFATYFLPKRNPLLSLRLDAPSPGSGCPQ